MIPPRRAMIAAAVFLSACSPSAPPPPKKAEPPKPITGLSAIFRMYQLARTWAPDAMPLRAQSVNLNEPKSDGGRAGAWTATFVSDSRKKQRTYSYSAIEGEGFHKDAFAHQEENWGGATNQSQSFRIEALKTDTDKAWEVASKKSEKYIKANPDMPVFFQVENTGRFPEPAWRVIWGESVSRSSYSIFVSTATGEYMQTGH